jgi:hypothetical protein
MNYSIDLKNIRVIQTHLVYMVGVPPEIAKEEVARDFILYKTIIKAFGNGYHLLT